VKLLISGFCLLFLSLVIVILCSDEMNLFLMPYRFLLTDSHMHTVTQNDGICFIKLFHKPHHIDCSGLEKHIQIFNYIIS
jgi:hypothetical protein